MLSSKPTFMTVFITRKCWLIRLIPALLLVIICLWIYNLGRSHPSSTGSKRKIRDFCAEAPSWVSEQMWTVHSIHFEIIWVQDGVVNNFCSLVKRILHRIQTRVEQRQTAARKRHAEFMEKLQSVAKCAICHRNLQGRLGNHMFMLASLYGIATNNKCAAFIDKPDELLEHHFQKLPILTRNPLPVGSIWKGRVEDEAQFGVFMPWLTQLNLTDKDVFALRGYLQSWKYFDGYRDDIKAMFLFKEQVYESALDELRLLISANRSDSSLLLPTLIGIHVRRGDMLESSTTKFGHTVASEEYYRNLIAELRGNYTTRLFFVATDDVPYCKNFFRGDDFLFLEENSEGVDMAILSLMDVLILSVGTFGWWSAYLSEAQPVFYYRNWPTPGSQMSQLIRKEDFFLPSWISRE